MPEQEALILKLESELERWRSYYGSDEPSDGVIGSAVGKIVVERNREIAKLKACIVELDADRERLDWLEVNVKGDGPQKWDCVLWDGDLTACMAHYEPEDGRRVWFCDKSIRVVIDMAMNGGG